ncbi:MAG: DUF1232 domain-containing protein [Verrucomicrobiota bacterium]
MARPFSMPCQNVRWKSFRELSIGDKLAVPWSSTARRVNRLKTGLFNFARWLNLGDMGEIVKFVHKGASRITPKILRGIQKELPLLKLEFNELQDPKYPHLADQLEFLADLVEDFAEGLAEDLPYVTVASATFALVYAHRQFDLIPDSVPEFGHADDSAVVRAVLIEHEKILSSYAEKQGKKWASISIDP